MPEGLPSPLISIIIPHHGGEQILRECLDSIFNSTYSNIEVIVLDNDSPDDSINIIQADFSDIIIIKSDHNRGFAGGCNFLSEHAKGDYLLILNNDTIHEKDWMIHLLKRIESNHNISSVQPKIKNYDKKKYFDHQVEKLLNMVRIQENVGSSGYKINKFHHCVHSENMAIRDGCDGELVV